ncbi:MAG TPA: hypothetical protein VKJ00_10890 [Thermoanaerobaculia bacterium]|nr:hypothetical protein [Thermoanaerobaculia bacterium]
MWIIRARVPGDEALRRLADIVRGDVVSSRRVGKEFVAVLVVHDDAEMEKLSASGAALEILSDSRTRPDPRQYVSSENRYAAEVERLKKSGPGGGKA